MTTERAPVIAFDEPRHRYTIDGDFVPSVTQAIDVSDPFAAGPWWGQRIGIAGISRLLQGGQLSVYDLLELDPDDVVLGRPNKVEKALTANRITVNHVRDQRGDEGTAIHYAIEQIAQTGSIPLLSDFDPELRGFVQAFSGWYVDQDPRFLFQELIVGSRQYRYAGRPDLGIAGPLEEELTIVDFKTSRSHGGPRCYDRWHLQGRGYRTAYNELLKWMPDDWLPCTESVSVALHDSGAYLVERHVCPLQLWLTTVERWWENEPFLEELAKRRNKSGKRRPR